MSRTRRRCQTGRAKRDQRLMVWEAQQQQSAPIVVEQRSPEQIVLDLLHVSDATVQQLAAAGLGSHLLLDALGNWVDRAARLGKIVIHGDLVARAGHPATRADS
jgi:hypothetical protein